MLTVKKIKPMFTPLVTTMDVYEEDGKIGNIRDVTKKAGTVKEYQTVLAIGDSVRGIKVGDLVSINPNRFAVKKHKDGSLKDGIISDNPVIEYRFDIVIIDNKPCLLLQDRDIEFVVEEWEETEDTSIIHPNKDIIL